VVALVAVVAAVESLQAELAAVLVQEQVLAQAQDPAQDLEQALAAVKQVECLILNLDLIWQV
jgi:hypothetical protein